MSGPGGKRPPASAKGGLFYGHVWKAASVVVVVVAKR